MRSQEFAAVVGRPQTEFTGVGLRPSLPSPPTSNSRFALARREQTQGPQMTPELAELIKSIAFLIFWIAVLWIMTRD